MKSLKVFGAAMLLVWAVSPAEAQMLKKCIVGMRVVDEAGAKGVITSDSDGMCNITFDDGQKWSRMFYVLRPASAAKENPAAPLASGEYDCAVGTGTFDHPAIQAMGRMDIQGMTYRFRPYGNVTNGFAPYTVGGDGSLHWGGRMGGLNIPPAKLGLSLKTPGNSFNIDYVSKPGAYTYTMSCHHL